MEGAFCYYCKTVSYFTIKIFLGNLQLLPIIDTPTFLYIVSLRWSGRLALL